MVYRCILPDWALVEFPNRKKVLEGEFSSEELNELNSKHYNIYFLPNFPSLYDPDTLVDGSQIDVFRYLFVDMDLKEGVYKDKDSFIEILKSFELLPTLIVDSGNGVHAYWEMQDLDVMNFLKLQRRLCRKFKSDEAVSKIYQLMRVPGTINTKLKDSPKPCEIVYVSENEYSCEQFDKLLNPIALADENYCKLHFEKTYKIKGDVVVPDKIPVKFNHLIKENQEVKEIWLGKTDDRSKSDYRLGHIMFGSGFSKEDAMAVLVNSQKALERAPIHRLSYAAGIIEKIWVYETEGLTLSNTVKDILSKSGNAIKGIRFPCWSYLDATAHGFRLGQVIGLVAGSGVGKTAMALNMFEGFVKFNQDYEHFFVPLEQPANEIADRWKTMCGENTYLHEKVHVISNYAEDGSFRHLSFEEIKTYILKFQETTGKKVGCVVIDHIGALKKKGKDGENQDLMTICHEMKAFAVSTNTLLIMQSQSSREKAGIGDLELNKDAAYGTVYFESYCDYLITIWQPLKRCYSDKACPTVTAFKFCKIRHKNKKLDEVQEDSSYRLYFDPETEHLRELTQEEETSFDYFNKKATNMRKLDRKTDIIPYQSITWGKEEKNDGTS